VPALRRYAVEAVGTLLVTLTVLGAATQERAVGAVAVAAVVGLALLAGGHANPVLTLAAVAGRRLPAGELLPYWAAQLLGALAGAALGRWLVDAPPVSPVQDVGVLVLLTVQVLFALVLCFVVLDGSSVDLGPGRGAAAAALTLLAAATVVDPVAAAAVNPAVAFGEVVAGVSGWTTIWVYVVGCPLGAALAGLAAGGLGPAAPRGQTSSRPG
jgi:aquaporin Z